MFHNTSGRKGRFARAVTMAMAVSITLSGCSTVSDWFADEEELEKGYQQGLSDETRQSGNTSEEDI